MNALADSKAAKSKGGMAFVAVLALQFVLVSWTFPISELLTETPLFNIDGAYHWYQIEVARALAARGSLTGYDPYFAGGYAGGVTLNASAKIQAVFAILLGSTVSTVVAYKLVTFAFALVAPIAVVAAARILNLRSSILYIAAGLAIVIWWASAFRWFHTAGLTSFVFASFLALPFIALMWRALGPPFSWTRTLGVGLLGAMGLLLHPLFPLAVIPSVVAYVVVEIAEIGRRRVIAVFGIVAALAILLNLPWILPMLSADFTIVGTPAYQRRVDITVLPLELLGIWSSRAMGAKIYSGLLVAAVAAAFWASGKERSVSRAFLLGSLLTGLYAYLGAALPGVGSIQPNRFSAVAYLLLVLPASIGIVELAHRLLHDSRRQRLVAIPALGICAVSVIWATIEVAKEVSYAPGGRYGAAPPEARPLGAASLWLLNWLRDNTTADARVLFETSFGRVHDGAHMAGYYAFASSREFIGGPYPLMFSNGAWDGHLFGKSVDQLEDSELSHLFDLYNIKWIVAHSKETKLRLERQPSVRQVADSQGVAIFTVDRTPTFFLKGVGRVAVRSIGQLHLAELDSREVILSYHFVGKLRSSPGTQLFAAQLLGVRQPFIGLRTEGRREATIYMD